MLLVDSANFSGFLGIVDLVDVVELCYAIPTIIYRIDRNSSLIRLGWQIEMCNTVYEPE